MAHLFERPGTVCERADSTCARHPAHFRGPRQQAGAAQCAQRAETRVELTRAFGASKLQELIDAAKRICHEDFGKTLAMTLLIVLERSSRGVELRLLSPNVKKK